MDTLMQKRLLTAEEIGKAKKTAEGAHRRRLRKLDLLNDVDRWDD